MAPRRWSVDPAIRAFVKKRLERGDSAKAIRETLRIMTSLSPAELDRRWPFRARSGQVRESYWRGLSGKNAELSSAEYHRIAASLSRSVRVERRNLRAEWRQVKRADAARNEALGIAEPIRDGQAAHDAGVLYRLTEDERYRERFDEGSP